MKFEIVRCKKIRPQKVVIYGEQGVGKTSLASKFPNPTFLDTEDGSGHLLLNRLPEPTSWPMLIEEVKYVRDFPYEVNGTLVIDTADWAQELVLLYYGSDYAFEPILFKVFARKVLFYPGGDDDE